ncbi:uncharacterized protein [Phyllobates terribilis]|uniref:uncharacterized protein n=1 Tax=Phyllobates terribilis TaxID=111132 RepID=UPI003CCB471E
MCASPAFLTVSSLTKSSFHGIRIGFPGSAHVAGGHISRRAQASTVVMMAKREEELKEIRAKTTDELHEEIIDLKGELFVLRLQKSARADFKNSEFSRMRKRIARMLTVKRERELEEGINKRLSRKLDRKWKKSIVFRPPPSLKKMQAEDSEKPKEIETSA